MWKRLAIWLVAALVTAILAFVLVDVACDQSYPVTWVARYDGPANSYDEARAVAVDGQGNVFVAGYSKGDGTLNDYATAKYDADGNQLWVARYDGPAGGHDKAYAIAVDSAGNTYVTGESEGEGTSYDYATIKYDPEGDQLWIARYDGPAGAGDGASGVAIDGEGNVYVTGYSAGGGSDYATIKYDSDGNQLWVARYNGPRGSADLATDLSIDSLNNAYVTGYSLGNETSYDYATIKYDTNGNRLWVARYDGPASRDDEAHAIAVDSVGNTYVSGYSTGGDSGTDYATVKYDPEGNQLWVARYNSPENGEDRANAIALGDSGHVWVAGSVRFAVEDYFTSDSVTIKYDSHGNQLWAARYDSPEKLDDGANAIALDNSGNVYVAGSSAGIGSFADYITLKYDTDGSQLWFARYNGPLSGADSAHAIALDGEGNVYVTGYSYSDDTSKDYATIKYTQ